MAGVPHTYLDMTATDEIQGRIDNGTYTFKTQNAADVELGAAEADRFRAVKSSGNGRWDIESEQTHPAPENGRIIIIHIGGAPHVNQRVGATLRLYSDDERAAAQEQARELAAAHQKMTVLVDLGNRVEAIEGTGNVGAFNPTTILMLKGSRTRYFQLENLKVIGVAKGYGKADALASEFQEKAAQVPVTEKPTFDGIPEYDGSGDQNTVAAAFLVEGPDFGNGREPGCMFLATDIQSEDGIVNGYFWAPSDAGLLTSESGSFYTRDLEVKAGRLRDYQPNFLRFRDAWALSSDRANGYAEVLGK